MGISLRPEHLSRYRDLAVLIAKYGRPGLVRQVGLEGAQVVHDDSQVAHDDSQVAHGDSQVAHGDSQVAHGDSAEEAAPPTGDSARDAKALGEALANDLERMGPTFRQGGAPGTGSARPGAPRGTSPSGEGWDEGR